MKLSSSEMFGRGKHEADGEAVRADEDTTGPRAGYRGEPTVAQPTFTPAEDGTVDDGADPVPGEVIDDNAPVTTVDGDLVTDEPARRSRMAYDRPAATGQPAAYDEPATSVEPEAFDRPASYDEPTEYDQSVAAYDEPGYNDPAGQPVTDAPMQAGAVADGARSADAGYPALDADEPTVPTGATEPAGTAAGVPAPRPASGTMATAPSSALSAGPMADLDQPLLTGTEFQTQWQRVQAGFVDDPRIAVAEAADLVEQAGDALATALRERQTRMRAVWDNGAGNGNGDAAGSTGDTEELRLMMRRYRGLFDQLSRL